MKKKISTIDYAFRMAINIFMDISANQTKNKRLAMQAMQFDTNLK